MGLLCAELGQTYFSTQHINVVVERGRCKPDSLCMEISVRNRLQRVIFDELQNLLNRTM